MVLSLLNSGKNKSSKLLFIYSFVVTILIFYLLHEKKYNTVENISYIDAEIGKYYNFKEYSVDENLPKIYIITPTYRRMEQIPELTRFAQTLLHVKNIFWIVAEDAPVVSQDVIEYLQYINIPYMYLRAQMPAKFMNIKSDKKPRGVANRNAAIEWIRKNGDPNGVVYFADDDNTYDLRIFEEIRETQTVSMFPVGLIGRFGLSTPIVKNGKVIDFYEGWIAGRKFPVDMAGFAFKVHLLQKFEGALLPFIVGYEEDGLLKALNIKIDMIEPKAMNCTKIWVWHTQTKRNEKPQKPKMKSEWNDSSLPTILKLIN